MRMRLPNGFGRITKLKQKLRKPWRAMVTVGITETGCGYKTKIVGFYKSYNEAYKALVDYHERKSFNYNPTIAEVFEDFFPVYQESQMWSDGYAYQINHAFEQMPDEFKKKHIQSVTPNDLLSLFMLKDLSKTSKARMKNLCNGLFEFAVKENIIVHNIAHDVKLPKVTQRAMLDKKVKAVFTPADIHALAVCPDTFAEAVLFQIYSGFRLAEMTSLTADSFDLEQGIVIGGVKTDAGKNRVVPIHTAIRSIVEKRLQSLQPSEKVFGEYRAYREKFNRLMKQLGIERSTHCCRKTFVSLAKSAHVDEYAIKRIVGHAITDITESVYTERSVDWLKEEMQKIPNLIK